MKYSLLFGLLFKAAFIFAQTEWTYLGDLEKTFGFWNEKTYIYEDNFQLKVTTDGGVTTETSDLMPGLLSPIIFVRYLDKDNLFLLQRDGAEDVKMHKSSDGGLTFTDLGVVGIPDGYNYINLIQMHFFDAQKGMLFLRTVNNGDPIDLLLKTADGGVSWELAASIEQTDGAEDMTFEDSETITIFGDNTIYRSTDFGDNWLEVGANPLFVFAEFATQGNRIWGVGDAGAQMPCRVISTDGGLTFSEWNIPDANAGGIDDCGRIIASLNENSLMVAEDGETILSSDAGQTFTKISFPDDPVLGLDALLLTDDGKTYLFRSAGEDTWAFTPGGTTPVNDLYEYRDILIYPNPSTNGIFNFSEALTNVNVYNPLGQLVHSTSGIVETINLNDLTKGMYFLRSDAVVRMIKID